MTKQTKAAPQAGIPDTTAQVTTAQVTARIMAAFKAFTSQTVKANTQLESASSTLELSLKDAAIAAGPVNASGYAKRFADVINGQIVAANKSGAIADSAVNVYKTRFKVWFIGHSNRRVHKAGDVGAARYYADMKEGLQKDKLLDVSTKGRKASPPATPASTTTPPTNAPQAAVTPPASATPPWNKTAQPLTGEVLSKSDKPDVKRVRALYIEAATFVMGGDKYAEALCMLIAQDKTRLTKMLDAFMVEGEKATKVAA